MKRAIADGEFTDEGRQGENCFLLSGFPRAPDSHGDVSCLIALTYNEKELVRENSAIKTLKPIFPECWNGNFIPHFVRCEEEFEEVYGWSHLALLEGDPLMGQRFHNRVYFGRELISGPFIVLGFDEKTRTYHHFHCVDCCHGIASFFIQSQPQWRKLYEASSRTERAHPISAARH